MLRRATPYVRPALLFDDCPRKLHGGEAAGRCNVDLGFTAPLPTISAIPSAASPLQPSSPLSSVLTLTSCVTRRFASETGCPTAVF
jgi:hypothetical protein